MRTSRVITAIPKIPFGLGDHVASIRKSQQSLSLYLASGPTAVIQMQMSIDHIRDDFRAHAGLFETVQVFFPKERTKAGKFNANWPDTLVYCNFAITHLDQKSTDGRQELTFLIEQITVLLPPHLGGGWIKCQRIDNPTTIGQISDFYIADGYSFQFGKIRHQYLLFRFLVRPGAQKAGCEVYSVSATILQHIHCTTKTEKMGNAIQMSRTRQSFLSMR